MYDAKSTEKLKTKGTVPARNNRLNEGNTSRNLRPAQKRKNKYQNSGARNTKTRLPTSEIKKTKCRWGVQTPDETPIPATEVTRWPPQGTHAYFSPALSRGFAAPLFPPDFARPHFFPNLDPHMGSWISLVFPFRASSRAASRINGS